ncbi:MAG: TniQ family protein [Mycobacterium sp.]
MSGELLDSNYPVGGTSRIRTLPIRVAPLAEESLESWLEALARRMSVSWGDLLRAVGMTDSAVRTAHDQGSQAHHVTPTQRQWLAITAATGFDLSTARKMTVAALMSVPTGVPLPHSVCLPGSRFCPQCLAERDGRWRSWWWLRWAFACPSHRCLLVSDCPACGRSQRVRPHPRELIPNPGVCTRGAPSGGRKPERCRQRLAYAPAVPLGPDHPAVVAQRDILSIIAAGSASEGVYTDSPASVEVFFRDLAALGQRMLRYAEPPDLRARLPGDLWADVEPVTGRGSRRDSAPAWAVTNQSSAYVTAAAACLAIPILLSDSQAAAGERLRWLVASMRRRGLTVSASNVGWGRNVSDVLVGVQLASLKPYLGPVDQLRHRGCTARPTERNSAAAVSRSLPALVWPRCAFRLETDGVGFEQLRAALSVAIVLVGSRMPVPAACALFGSTTHERAVSRVLQRLYARADWEQCVASLLALRDSLEAAAPIDYARRRGLDYADLLPTEQWHDICHDLAVPAGRSTKARLHRCWLYERVTGSPAITRSPGRGDPPFRAALADLPRTLSPELFAALDDAGHEFLVRHDVRDEPLTWCPDLTDTGLESAAYRRVETHIDEVHRLVADRLSLGEIANRTDTTIDVIRELLTEHPAP